MADREIEAKLTLSDPEVARGLTQWPTLAYRYPLTTPFQVVDVDTYYDTVDLRLLRNGITMRLRERDGSLFATTKSIELEAPKGMHKRKEVERETDEIAVGAPSLLLSELPDDVADAVDEVVGAKELLLPYCQLEQVRTKRNLLHPDGRRDGASDDDALLAELSIDAVTVRKPEWPERPGHKRKRPRQGPLWVEVTQFNELEAELKGDTTRGELKSVAAKLRELPGLVANRLNKIQMALVAMAEADEAEPGAASSLHVAELCRRAWAQQLVQMLITEAGVRDSTDIEYVHDMRVATRRARAAGRLYGAYFDPASRRVRRFLKELRTTGRRLGTVRDLDVALARLELFTEERPKLERDGLDRLHTHWSNQRRSAHAKLLDWLDSDDYRDFIVDWRDFVRTPGADVPPFAPLPGEAPLPHQLRHTIPSMVLSSYESIRAFEPLFESADEVPVETLHALRIECKTLRYHLEFNQALLGAEGAELIAALKALQEHLGDLNDASVARAMIESARPFVSAFDEDAIYFLSMEEIDVLRAMGKEPLFPDADDEGAWGEGGALHAYLTRQDAVMNELITTLPTDLERFLSYETRRKLVDALARI